MMHASLKTTPMNDDHTFCRTQTLSYWLIQAGKAHRARAQEVLAAAGLYPGQEMILMSLWNENGQTLSSLAEGLCVQPATVTKMVTRMEKAGFIERRPDPNDGRSRRIYLTDAGLSVREETLGAWMALEADTVRFLSSDEQNILRNLLDKVADGLRSSVDDHEIEPTL
jgi:DNA-binding MarR family transcriptional regulator